jgi:hypothetical protein
MDNVPDDDDGPRAKAILLVTCAVFVGVYLLWSWLGARPFSEHKDVTNAGAYGSAYTYVESLFSGLAFAGVIIAIFLQWHELGLQRKELRATKHELARSAEAHEDLKRTSALTAYLAACSTLATAFSQEADGPGFHSSRMRFTRLTAHLDWLLSSMRAGNIPTSFAADDRREMRHALQRIGRDWEDWLAVLTAEPPYANKLAVGLETLCDELGGLVDTFANGGQFTDVQNLPLDIRRSIPWHLGKWKEMSANAKAEEATRELTAFAREIATRLQGD